MYPVKFSGIFLFLLILILNCAAAIRVVDNHVPTPAGTYATILLSSDAASKSDTLIQVSYVIS
jgi:hypothetical protein